MLGSFPLSISSKRSTRLFYEFSRMCSRIDGVQAITNGLEVIPAQYHDRQFHRFESSAKAPLEFASATARLDIPRPCPASCA